jgi:Fe-S cluster biogenesis protein NfuA/nitrite reductase/ring-hydroxylating ferredoxin subunit
MYGAGLERIVELIEDDETRDRLAADELVAGLLMIHDLYPVPIEERVVQALDTVRPYMESHGGNVELLGIEDGVAKLRLEGSCKSCRASSSTLELAVRQALQEAAPDLLGMDVEGVVEDESEVTGTALPMANGAPAWHTVDIPPPERMSTAEVAGSSLVVANVEGTLLAYRNACASCNGPLEKGELDAGALVCPSCGRGYFLPQAGRSMDDERLQLQPIPLLREGEEIRVAL